MAHNPANPALAFTNLGLKQACLDYVNGIDVDLDLEDAQFIEADDGDLSPDKDDFDLDVDDDKTAASGSSATGVSQPILYGFYKGNGRRTQWHIIKALIG
ncbi:hypothetical protein VNI00_018143 [Paramarasmius palmivorus]|uniref:Uncharacterized protein n=1 Tax=Paramarasmius palmivorus TaxID=297713 RepID=A0AAW0AZV4_9AGAR